jgi:Fe-S-cluster containining protein
MPPNTISHLIAASAGAEYDCRRCGACCLTSTPGPGYVLLTDDEPHRLRSLGLPMVNDAAGQPRLGTLPHDAPGGTDACCAFEGAPGHPCICTIYDARPTRCREFEMGSEACRRARLRAGLAI